jgi:hypothetical protein
VDTPGTSGVDTGGVSGVEGALGTSGVCTDGTSGVSTAGTSGTGTDGVLAPPGSDSVACSRGVGVSTSLCAENVPNRTAVMAAGSTMSRRLRRIRKNTKARPRREPLLSGLFPGCARPKQGRPAR